MFYAVMESPLGPLTVAASGKGVAAVHFGNVVPKGAEGSDALSQSALGQLAEYFDGKRTSFDLPLDVEGTAFQKAVWNELQRIPYGETRSYGEIAKALGKPGAARAVGSANHNNPVAIVIPCHRVVGQDGSLTGYAGGVHLKQQLLAIESHSRPLFT